MRTSRKLVAGARYHVIARTTRKNLLMDTELVKDMFLEVVVRAKAKYDFQIENFCGMVAYGISGGACGESWSHCRNGLSYSFLAIGHWLWPEGPPA
jgi:hypothetical protein